MNRPPSPANRLLLSVNIDHVATLRNARGGEHPDVLRAARQVRGAGADGLTVHLREDRRHIRDHDVRVLREWGELPLNLEMAATDEMAAIAWDVSPDAICLVPENRAELTTEGGLNVTANEAHLAQYVTALRGIGARISLFVDPVEAAVAAARRIGTDVIELHTGALAEAVIAGDQRKAEMQLVNLDKAARLAVSLGVGVHAGHGLDFASLSMLAARSIGVSVYHVGHFLIGEAVFLSLSEVVVRMRTILDDQESSSVSSAHG